VKAGERLELIDIARGIAILGVLWQHLYAGDFVPPRSDTEIPVWQLALLALNNGQLGVNLFFVLSGFVLFHPRFLGEFDAVRFYKRRIFRLWPLYVVILAVCFALDRASLGEALGQSVLLLSGVHSLIPRYWMPNSLWVLWSLGIEILFSVCLPFLIWFCARWGVFRVAIALLVLCFLYRIGADQLYYFRHPDFGNPLINPLKDNILGRMDDFVVGMAASYCVYRRAWTSAVPAAFALLGLYASGLLTAILLVAERTVAVSVIASLSHTLFAVSAGVLIVSLLNRPLWAAAAFRPLIFLGQICYSAYLVHALVLKHWREHFDFASPPSSALYLAITIGLSFLCFSLIEVIGIGQKPGWWRGIAGALRRG
jgi:peptidoglycan/LPS O-acetylase OafA/YrhL